MTVVMAPPKNDPAVATPTRVLYLAAPTRDRAAAERLAQMGLDVVRAGDLAEALRMLATRTFTVCFVDLADERLAVPSIRTLASKHPELPIAGIIDPARPLTAAEAVHAGAAGILGWPFDEAEVAGVVADACDQVCVDTVEGDAAVAGNETIFAHSPAMRHVLEEVRRAAHSSSAVLVAGEPGAGRSLVARAIHALGPGSAEPFVRIDCASGGPDELDLRLFGLVAERTDGSKTRHVDRVARGGALAHAQGGTLLLANLVEAPARIQAKIARLARDREAYVIEKRAMVDLDVRFVGSVEPSVDAALADGRLRRDLVERLGHTRIDVPPLRQRREDIPLLAVYLLGELSLPGAGAKRFTRAALALLSALPWPGNGRELRALVETLVGAVHHPVIRLDDLLARAHLDGIAARPDTNASLREAKARFEREWISAVLMKHHGRVEEAARALGMQRTNLYRKVRQLNVARELLASRKLAMRRPPAS